MISFLVSVVKDFAELVSTQKSAYVKSVLPNILPKRENKYRTAIRLK